jgi:hypothetical protein
MRQLQLPAAENRKGCKHHWLALAAVLMLLFENVRGAFAAETDSDQGQLENHFVFGLALDYAFIPLPEAGWCTGKGILENPVVGIQIVEVRVDGKLVTPEGLNTDGAQQSDTLHNASPFTYLLHGSGMMSMGSHQSPGMKMFRLPTTQVSGVKVLSFEGLAISYRVRCSDGLLSPMMTAKGIREDVARRTKEMGKTISPTSGKAPKSAKIAAPERR